MKKKRRTDIAPDEGFTRYLLLNHAIELCECYAKQTTPVHIMLLKNTAREQPNYFLMWAEKYRDNVRLKENYELIDEYDYTKPKE